MSEKIALSSKLPGEPDINGLDALHDAIINDPERVVVAIVWLDCPKITKEIGPTGSSERPTMRVRRIEPIGEPEELPAELVRLVQAAQEQRTGKIPLPIDVVEVPRHEVVDEGRDDV